MKHTESLTKLSILAPESTDSEFRNTISKPVVLCNLTKLLKWTTFNNFPILGKSFCQTLLISSIWESCTWTSKNSIFKGKINSDIVNTGKKTGSTSDKNLRRRHASYRLVYKWFCCRKFIVCLLACRLPKDIADFTQEGHDDDLQERQKGKLLSYVKGVTCRSKHQDNWEAIASYRIQTLLSKG